MKENITNKIFDTLINKIESSMKLKDTTNSKEKSEINKRGIIIFLN
jgi:hypothetical protein